MHTSLRPLFLLAAIAAPAHAQSLADQRRAAGDTWRQGRLTHAVEIDNDSLLLRIISISRACRSAPSAQ
jgi:hypothetical protein